MTQSAWAAFQEGKLRPSEVGDMGQWWTERPGYNEREEEGGKPWKPLLLVILILLP